MRKKKPHPGSEELEEIKNYSSEFYLKLLGYKPDNTSLNSVSDSKWEEFSLQLRLDSNSSGVYFPRSQTAIIRDNNLLSLFHEYFGHGLYCEQSLSGRKLVELEKKLLEEEKLEFKNKCFSFEELKEFRKSNLTAQELERLKEQNLGIYEGFAVFTEYFLSKKFNTLEQFEQKYDSLLEQDKEDIERIINFNRIFGNLATFYAYGMKKIQDQERLMALSKDLFGKDLERVKLITHFGSGREFSDVDLFVVSNEIQPIYSDDWIDVRVQKTYEIENNIRNLDPKLTCPLFSGNFLFGDGEYLKRTKQRISAQSITMKQLSLI